MKHKILIPAVLTAVATLLLASPRAAAAVPASVSLAPAVGPPTVRVVGRGSGFAAGEQVVFLIDRVRIGAHPADPNGAVKASLTAPATAPPGQHTLRALGRSGGVSAAAGFLVRTDWPQGCFDVRRSCFDPYENVLAPANVGALTLAWRASVGASRGTAPVYVDGKLFVGTANGLVGLDPSTGAIIINYSSRPVSSSPAAIGGFDPQPDPPGKVIFGSTDGILHAVSTAGVQVWQVALGAPPTSPLVIQGTSDSRTRVIVGAGRALFAFDGNGRKLWSTVLDGGNISTPAALLDNPQPKPDRVIVPAGNTLSAVDLASGAAVWTSAPSRSSLGAPAIGNPNIGGDPNVLVGDAAATLYSIDSGTGAVLARFAAGGAIAGSPAIRSSAQAGPALFLGDRAGDIYAIDSTDDFPPPVWQAALGGPVDGPPVLANGVLYLATDPAIGDPGIFALDAATGLTLFRTALPGGVASGPILADGRLVVETNTGDVLAYQGPDS
jgi:outer membrane protein assembly factor BamB